MSSGLSFDPRARRGTCRTNNARIGIHPRCGGYSVNCSIRYSASKQLGAYGKPVIGLLGHPMYRTSVWLAFLTLLLTPNAFADCCRAKVPAVPEPLSVYSQLPGYFWAKSARPDETALGGFGQSRNVPHELDPDSPYAKKGIQLVVLPKESERFLDRYEGFTVLLINGSAAELWLSASDSRLPIIREALDADGGWKPVEYLPSSWCGNSYHRVFISPGQYWRFAAPRYAGTYVTQMRFRLTLWSDQDIFSNEFSGTMNRNQFPRSLDASTRKTICGRDLERLPVDNIQGAVGLGPGVVTRGGRPR